MKTYEQALEQLNMMDEQIDALTDAIRSKSSEMVKDMLRSHRRQVSVKQGHLMEAICFIYEVSQGNILSDMRKMF